MQTMIEDRTCPMRDSEGNCIPLKTSCKNAGMTACNICSTAYHLGYSQGVFNMGKAMLGEVKSGADEGVKQ